MKSAQSALRRPLAAALVSIGCLLTSGCGLDPVYTGNCTRQDYVGAGAQKGDADFTLTPTAGSSVTMFPGQTLTVPMAISGRDGSTGTVNILAAGLPFGVSILPSSGQIGSTANVTFVSTPQLGSECFEGISQIYTSHATVAVEGSGPGGVSAYGLDLEMVLENPAYKPAKTTIATLDLETAGAAPVDSKDDYVTGTVNIVDPNNKKNNYTGAMQVKGHGNTTWIMPKKPYRLKLNSKSGLLGMPSEKNWILLANYADKSMLRDALASQVSNIAGLPWAPRSAFVELTLNGSYQGTYELIENIDINSNRIDIADLDDGASSPDQNGYLLEIDQREGDTYHWLTPHGIDVGSDDPDPPTQPEEVYIHDQVDAAEASFYAANASDPTSGWRSHWNGDSVVEWFIVNELMGNHDANAFSSDYFYKDAGASPFFLGPVWDFDVSSGNDNYGAILYPTVPWVRTQHPWFVQLFATPGFEAAVRQRWAQIRPQIETLPAYIDSEAAGLQTAAANNYERWPTLYQRVWPNPEAAGSYQGEVIYLKSWLEERVAYMDQTYPK